MLGLSEYSLFLKLKRAEVQSKTKAVDWMVFHDAKLPLSDN